MPCSHGPNGAVIAKHASPPTTSGASGTAPSGRPSQRQIRAISLWALTYAVHSDVDTGLNCMSIPVAGDETGFPGCASGATAGNPLTEPLRTNHAGPINSANTSTSVVAVTSSA